MKTTFIFTHEWSYAVCEYIKIRRKLRKLTLNDISERLEHLDIRISSANLGNRINSGRMSSNLFLAILSAMNETHVNLNEILSLYETRKKHKNL